ncbi:unnamed protein product [Caenorhabditis sp. 36 PRJEB53466]|nr:unnamed protein product [Caenorhabditis sp. 36 PRJEB53466]
MSQLRLLLIFVIFSTLFLEISADGEKRAIHNDAFLIPLTKTRAVRVVSPSSFRHLPDPHGTHLRILNVGAEEADTRHGADGFSGNLAESLPKQQDRPKRDMAATVVGAAVSSVVNNLMKNAAHKNEETPKKAADVPQGAIIESGEIPPISNEIVPLPFVTIKANNPVANEIVALPAAQIKADAPVSNEIVPLPVAPIHADVEVVVGNNVTSTSTTASTEKKGFWSTFFGSIKLFFETLTNSIGGFFIDIGNRVSGFVEKRVNV